MKQILVQVWDEQDGVLSFEWVLLLTLLTIGIVSGLAAARDAIIDELGDVAEATMSLDQSYSLAGIPALGILESAYTDDGFVYSDCARSGGPVGQPASEDGI